MKRGDIVSYVDGKGRVHHALIYRWGGNPDRNLSLLELTERSEPVTASIGYDHVTEAGDTYRGEVLLTIEAAVCIGERILTWLKSDAGKLWMHPPKAEVVIDESRGHLEPYQIPLRLANGYGKMTKPMENYLAIWHGRYTQALKRVGGRGATRLDVWIALHHEGFTKSQVAKGEAYARYYSPDHQEIKVEIPPMDYEAVRSHERKAKAKIREYVGPEEQLSKEGMTPLEIKQTQRRETRPVHLVTDVEAENARPGCYSCGVAFTRANRSMLPDVCRDCLRFDLGRLYE